MTQAILSISRRTRRTPFTRRVTSAGVKGYTVYNRMLLPSFFESVEADYHHLKEHVQVWDVACERQVEIRGADAGKLAQLLTPRNLGKLREGRCFYTPVCDDKGGMLNDPLMIKLSDERYWVSIADSDFLLWVKGLSLGLGLDVDVFEPDVSPLAIQGPKSDDLLARVMGEAVREIGFFGYNWFPFMGSRLLVARSGYSKQGGFEIYVAGSDLGEPLWDALFAAGEDLHVRAGCPNLIERIEAGLLSYGNDMTAENTPHECGLGKYCQPELVSDFMGRERILQEAQKGPKQQIRSMAIDGPPLAGTSQPWPLFYKGERVGQVTSAAWSPDFKTNVSLGMVARSYWSEGQHLEVETPDGMRTAVVKAKSFI